MDEEYDPQLLPGSFNEETWRRIVIALQTFILVCEGQQRDKEVSIYKGIARDIEDFILPLPK